MSEWPYNFIAFLFGMVFVSLGFWLMPDAQTRWGIYALIIGMWLLERAAE